MFYVDTSQTVVSRRVVDSIPIWDLILDYPQNVVSRLDVFCAGDVLFVKTSATEGYQFLLPEFLSQEESNLNFL